MPVSPFSQAVQRLDVYVGCPAMADTVLQVPAALFRMRRAPLLYVVRFLPGPHRLIAQYRRICDLGLHEDGGQRRDAAMIGLHTGKKCITI